MNRILAALILSVIYTAIDADAGNLKGYVVSETDWHPVEAAYVSVFSGDSVSLMTQTDTDGLFSVDIPADKEIEIAVTALGFENLEMKMNTDTISAPILIYLREAILTTDLDEITVEADKSNVVRRTANGQIFFLSKEAKKEHNPFLALSEIPILNSDYTSSSIKLLDGKQPLILIDGNQVNSGIAPILPADIESVEVITTVPARYLQEGYSGIVNIKLRKNRAPYIWFGGSYSQYIPTSSSSGPGINFEIGNEKFSVYGSGLYYYARNAKTRSETDRSNTGYNQHFSSLTNSSSDQYYGWLLLKYLPSSKDYLAASFRYNNARQSSTTGAEGTFITDETEKYTAEGSDRNRNSTLSATAPSTALLNPRNTSTDPLLVNSGNPHLKPRTDNRVTLTYTFNKNGWYVSPMVSYQHSRDIITPS